MTEAIPRPPLVVLLVAVAFTIATLDRYGPLDPALAAVRSVVRSGLVPVEAAAGAAVRPAGDLVAGIGRGQALARENAALRQALASSQAERASVEALTTENAGLNALLGLKAPVEGAPVAARVLSLPAGPRGGTFLLDRGRADGLEPGMPVVGAGGLVGRVVEATQRRALALPLSDATSTIGVRVGADGLVGVAQGQGRTGRLRLGLLDSGASVSRGDLVVTSGLRHSRFPAGLPVGRVLRNGGPGAELEVLADPTRLEVVEVLPWRAPA
jgi:rod shape-determining protein MreC